MSRKLLFLSLFFVAYAATAQNPSTVIQLPVKEIVLPCGTTCTSITATVPHIRQSDDYTVQSIPYQPFLYAGDGTELTALYADDIYSSIINLPFPVCFYGTTYNSLVVGSNGIVTFDITNAGRRNNFRQTVSFSNTTPVLIPFAGGVQNSLSQTYYPKAAIMGVYHDVFPFNNGSRRIEWRIEGTAPKRRFIASFRDVPMYSCTSLSATHQMIVYESTGVVEVYVQDKPVCTAWNEGLAILGIQNSDRNKANFPAGKNTSRWGSMNMNEAYRFTPSSGLSKFKKAELMSGENVVAIADTASAANGTLSLNFANVCPTADSTRYILRVTYQACHSTTQELSFEDTLTIKKYWLDISLQKTDPTCTAGGSFIVNTTGTAASLLYSLNGGQPQASPVFNNLPAGDYTVRVSSAGTCVKTASASLTLQDDLLLVAQPAATVCAGEVFTPHILSNATSFHWSPSSGMSNATGSHPQITAQSSSTYTLTATKGICQQTAKLDVIVKPLPKIYSGGDQTIVAGDAVKLPAFAPEGAFLWSPAAGLSSATILQPLAMPVNTTTYHLNVTANGCTTSDSLVVTVVPYCVKPMEAFSPNGDGINDFWLVTTGSCLHKAGVEVFNRYGARVYQNPDYNNNWNGNFQGKPLPDGTYYFIITYQLINGRVIHQKGSLTILR
jgi:gliding motility-associated-like protein